MSDALTKGRKALADGAWEEARAAFENATSESPTPEAVEGLGMARWWLLDLPGSIEAREHAYRLYRDAGDVQAAARMAVWIASDHLDRGDSAIANGWLQRAQRLLEHRPSSHEHVFLDVMRGHIALMGKNDPESAIACARRAREAARTSGAQDWEILALALEGVALVSEGRVEEGMPLLDEATAAATSGEIGNLYAVGWACCYLIHACYRVRDYDRAAQWCDRVQSFCRRWRFDSMFTTCRTHYASILMWRGKLQEAEEELATLRHEAEGSLPPLVRSAIVRMGDLRRRQGRYEEAAELFDQAPDHKLAILGRAALTIDGGNPGAAAEMLEAHLRRLPRDARSERLPALELLVRAYVDGGDAGRATQTQEELREIADVVRTEPVRAAAELAEGLVARARGEPEKARTLLEDAVYLFDRNNAVYEAAQTRLELARALADLGRAENATAEAEAARDAFRQMGAAAPAGRTEELLSVLSGRRDEGGAAGGRGLTKREVQVLRLIAEGLTDKEIASRLQISEHTVHRHVSNILTKSGQSSRAAAVAQAAREGVL